MTEQEEKIYEHNRHTNIEDVYDNNKTVYEEIYKNAPSVNIELSHWTKGNVPCYYGVVRSSRDIPYQNEIRLSDFFNIEKLDNALRNVQPIDISKITFKVHFRENYDDVDNNIDMLSDEDKAIINKVIAVILLSKCNSNSFFDSVRSILAVPKISELSGYGGISGYLFNNYLKGTAWNGNVENDCDVISLYLCNRTHSKEGHPSTYKEYTYTKKLKNGKTEERWYKRPKNVSCIAHDSLVKTFDITITFNKIKSDFYK